MLPGIHFPLIKISYPNLFIYFKTSAIYGMTYFRTICIGLIMLNFLFSFLFIRSCAGDLQIKDCGVIQYCNKNVRNLSEMDSISFSFFIAVLNVLTDLSAHRLVAG